MQHAVVTGTSDRYSNRLRSLCALARTADLVKRSTARAQQALVRGCNPIEPGRNLVFVVGVESMTE